MSEEYVHGYTERETERLYDQAGSVKELLHNDSIFKKGEKILEAGCGVGAQTVTLATQNKECEFISIDISHDSIKLAESLILEENIKNVTFQQADIFNLPFSENSFDHAFICYVLEHLKEPVTALKKILKTIKHNGSITAIEGDHGSCYFHPSTKEAMAAWNCLIKVQATLGGNSLIGRQLYPLMRQAGLKKINVMPRMVYIDQSKPDLMDSFVRRTIIPMVVGIESQAKKYGFIDNKSWEKGINDLHRIADNEAGTFCYTFFKAKGIK